MEVVVSIKATLTRVLILLAWLSVSELSAQEQVGEVFPHSFTSVVPSSIISELRERTLIDVYWTGNPSEFSDLKITRLVAQKIRLISATEPRPYKSVFPNLMQAEITVEMDAETIRTQQSLAGVGRFTITASQ